MNTSPPNPAAPRGFRRVAPAFALFFLSPFVAEYLLGDISVSAPGLLLVMAPLYGGGALVVREVARRLGRGWPTIVLLALAYGLLEEGIVIQTLFNPNYLGLHLLQQAFIPALGIGGWWTSFVLPLHLVWSISVPIAITEALFADRRTTPWLGPIGLGVSALLLAAGGILIHTFTRKHDPFAASNLQLAATWGLIVVITAVALRCRPAARSRAGTPPTPWVVGATTLVLGVAFMASHAAVHDWPAAGVNVALVLIGAGLLLTWSRQTGWTAIHSLMAAAGLLLTYAIYGFPQEPVVGAKGPIDLLGNTLFAAIAVVLLVLALRKERKLAPPAP